MVGEQGFPYVELGKHAKSFDFVELRGARAGGCLASWSDHPPPEPRPKPRSMMDEWGTNGSGVLLLVKEKICQLFVGVRSRKESSNRTHRSRNAGAC